MISIFLSFHQSMTLFSLNKATGNDGRSSTATSSNGRVRSRDSKEIIVHNSTTAIMTTTTTANTLTLRNTQDGRHCLGHRITLYRLQSLKLLQSNFPKSKPQLHWRGCTLYSPPSSGSPIFPALGGGLKKRRGTECDSGRQCGSHCPRQNIHCS